MKKTIRIFTLSLALLLLFTIMPVSIYATDFDKKEDTIEGIDVQWLSENRTGLAELTAAEVDENELLVNNQISNNKVSEIEREYWSKYSNDYFYKQLPDNYKIFWKELEDGCLNVITGTQDVEYIVGTCNNANINDVKKIVQLFIYSNPQYYFIASSYSWYYIGYDMYVGLYVYSEFQSGLARQQVTSQFRNKIDGWVSTISQESRPEDKEKIANDIICENTVYGQVYSADGENRLDQSAYSLVLRGQTVCAGYTKTMSMLMNATGVETIAVTSVGHAWNVINIHNQWFNVDTTWNDQDYGTIYWFYNKSDATIQSNNSSHFIEAHYGNYSMPDSPYDSTNAIYYYIEPYFTEENYVYFMVNDNLSRGKRYVKIVDKLNSAELDQWPFSVDYLGNTYEVLGAMDGINGFVNRLYSLVLSRNADASGFEAWTAALKNKEFNGITAGYWFVFSTECLGRNLSNDAYIEMLYNAFMDRQSDSNGKAAWMSYLEAGVDREFVLQGFILSTEFRGICENYGIDVGQINDSPEFAEKVSHYRNQNINITKYIARCYTQALGRNYDVSGLESWCEALIKKSQTPKQAAQNFIFSQEFLAKNLNNEEYLKVLYRTFMGREYDQSGLDAWLKVLNNGSCSREMALESFADSIEFAGIMESFGLN